MRKSRPITHPDWLKQAMDDFKKTTQLHERGILPGSIEFFMISTPIYRMMRCCFPNRWAVLWWVFCDAIGHERERLYGVLYRFWRYRVKMKSQDEDFHKMMTSLCPFCHERHEIPQIKEDVHKCEGCGAEMDFGELVMSQPEDEDDE